MPKGLVLTGVRIDFNMFNLYNVAQQFKLLYLIPPVSWLMIIVGFLVFWTVLMFSFFRKLPLEQNGHSEVFHHSYRRSRVAMAMNLVLTLLGLMIIFLVTFARRGSSEHYVILIPLRGLFGLLVPGDYWQVMVMNLVLYIPFACGLVFCVEWSRGWPGNRPDLATVLICLFLSIAAETLQYLAGSGIAEMDDVLMNTLGGTIGVLPWYVCSRKKRMEKPRG